MIASGKVEDRMERGQAVELEANWDDDDGYYVFKHNDVIDDRFQVISTLGRGVFSSVFKAVDVRDGKDRREVAIKIIRANNMMEHTGMKELSVLQDLNQEDPEDRRHIVRLFESFRFRGHLCIVLEVVGNLNLRKVIAKYGDGRGLAFKAVRSYTKQILTALRHMHKLGMVHADLKPDNMVISQELKLLKVCDMGSVHRKHELSELDETRYLVSRYYRAPEIVLGLTKKDCPLDIWSAGCAFIEMYTGKILFTGETNNDILKSHIEVCGKVPRRLQRQGIFTGEHFDSDGVFLHNELTDKVTRKRTQRSMPNLTQTREIYPLLLRPHGKHGTKTDAKLREDLSHFANLVGRALTMDPKKRITAEDALKHRVLC